MKREIKFKAKVKYNGNHLFSGDWVFGYYWENYKEQSFIHVIEIDEFGNITREFDVEIDPDTVCQFTGLQDKNGVDIYEGDECEFIIIGVGKGKAVIKFENGCFQVFAEGQTRPMPLCFLDESTHKIEVIGNIHDKTDKQ